VCEAAVEALAALGAARAGVLLFDDDGVMRCRSWRNLSAAYRAAVDGYAPWSRDTTDPKLIVVEDVLTDPSIASLREIIVAEGMRSLAFVPLVSHGHLLGTFTIAYDEPHAFSTAELRLTATITQHVAFGLARVLAEGAFEDLLPRAP